MPMLMERWMLRGVQRQSHRQSLRVVESEEENEEEEEEEAAAAARCRIRAASHDGIR
jgi:hypothetical protein